MAATLLPSVPAITSAFLLKLTTSLDDLLWLSPFLSLSPSIQNKLKHSVVYFIICVLVTMLAFVFGTSLLALMTSGSDGKPHEGYWNPERFLSIFSASVLLYIARNDYAEWKEENASKPRKSGKPSSMTKTAAKTAVAMGNQDLYHDHSNGSYDSGSHTTGMELQVLTPNGTRRKSKHQKLRLRAKLNDPEVAATESSDHTDDDMDTIGSSSSDDSDEDEIRTKIEEASKSLRRFITVCVMGTLDDMIVFSAFVAGGAGSTTDAKGTSAETLGHNYLALFIGTTFAALLIVTVSWFFSEIECFKRLVKKIPMWGLLTGIALYILVMGLI